MISQKAADKEKRGRKITITYSDEEYEKIKRNAEKLGLDVDSYLRTMSLNPEHYKEKIPKVDKRRPPADITPKAEGVELLRNLKLLANLKDGELQAVSRRINIRRYEKDDTVLVQNMPNNHIFMILSGKLKASQTTHDGKEIILSTYQAGEYLGEMSVIEDKPASATVTAMEKSSVALLSKETFYNLLPEQKGVILGLLEVLCSRIRTSNEKIEMLSYTNASQRIKMLFLTLVEKYGTKKDNFIELEIRLTHQDIADMTGLIRETVTRIINQMIKSGDVSVSEKRFISFAPDFVKQDFCQ